MSAHSDNPGRKAKGRNLGESRGHRAGRQQKVPGQHKHAGIDQSMKRRFRRSWYALSGASKERLGFSDFYGRTGHALVNVLNTHDSSLGLARFSAY